MYAEQWVCRDGRRLHVFEMTDSHLAYSIARIKRLSWRVRWLPRLEAELANRKKLTNL